MHIHQTLESTAASNRWTPYRVGDRVVLCGCLLGLAFVLPPWPWALCIFLVSSAFACFWAKVPIRVWATALTPIVIFGLVGAVPLWWMNLPSGQAVKVSLRALSAGSAVVLLVTTTPAGELVAAAQGVRSLGPLVEITFLILRFFTILRETAASTAIAWHCRCGEQGWARFRFSLHGVASIFLRAFERARRMDEALALRSASANLQFWAPSRPVSWRLRVAGILIGGFLSSAAILLREAFPWS